MQSRLLDFFFVITLYDPSMLCIFLSSTQSRYKVNCYIQSNQHLIQIKQHLMIVATVKPGG